MNHLIIIYSILAIQTLVMLQTRYHIFQMFKIENGTLMFYTDWYEGMFTYGRELIRLIPLFCYPKEWTIFYKGYNVCSCERITSYTRKGAISKCSKLYDIKDFNLDRMEADSR